MFQRSYGFGRIRPKRDALKRLTQGVQDEQLKLLIESGSAYEWVARDWMHEELDGEVSRNYETFSNGQRFPRDADGEAGGADEYDIEHCRCELAKAEEQDA